MNHASNRPEAIARSVLHKARTLGAHDYEHLAVHHALNSYAQNHCAARAIRRGVTLAAELADKGGDQR